MRVSVVQMSPGHDKMVNIANAKALMDGTEASRPDIVSLPEMWSCLGGDRDTKFSQAEELPPFGSGRQGGHAYEFLRGMALSLKSAVHGGSIGEREGERLFNTTVVFSPDGTELARYRKIHLFDITTPDGTGYRESATYGAGDELASYRIGDLHAGCAICYDIRFPGLFMALRRRGCDLIFLPSAFTVPTGRDHWEVLIRARAIETQCWFVAPATWGNHVNGRGEVRSTYGHSLICDPWGRVVAELPEGTGTVSALINPELTAKVRRDMPMLEHGLAGPRALETQSRELEHESPIGA